MTRRLALVLVAITLWAPAIHAAAPDVRFADGRITADVRDVELADLLDAIAAKAGFEIRGKPTAHTVTVRLDDVPVADAIARLVEKQRVAYTYDRDGDLKRIEFLDVGAEVSFGAPAEKHPAAPAEEPKPAGVAPRDRPVAVDGLLAGALGSNQSTFTQIVAVALQSGDKRLRKEALRVALGLLDADAELRADVSSMLDALDDAALAARLEEVAGAHAEETALQTARLSHWKPLRRRAGAVLPLLRSNQ